MSKLPHWQLQQNKTEILIPFDESKMVFFKNGASFFQNNIVPGEASLAADLIHDAHPFHPFLDPAVYESILANGESPYPHL